MSLEKINQYHLILGSSSPRRQYLLKEIGIQYEIKLFDVDEKWPPHMHREEIPVFLSELKAAAFPDSEFDSRTILITADTIVLLD
jgi:septum formation protein